MRRSDTLLAGLIISLFMSQTLVGCSGSLYSLPAPPPRSEWVAQAAESDIEQSKQNLRYIDARATALKLYTALSTSNIRDAEPLLANETIEFITKNGELTLEDALSKAPEDADVQVLPPLMDLLAPDMSQLVDNVPGIPENESETRVEMFSPQKDGTYRRIVMVRDKGPWQLLRTTPPTPIRASTGTTK